MGRRELRESAFFKDRFMTEFNDTIRRRQNRSKSDLEGIEDIQDKDQSYIQDKFEKL